MKRELQSLFEEHFGELPALYAAPGRVNLIGEHTDYNGGFVLPGAIDRGISVALRLNDRKESRLFAVDFGEAWQGDLTTACIPEPVWARYIYGVVQELRLRRVDVPNFDCAFTGDIPRGLELASSAALTVAAAYALDDLLGSRLPREVLAKVCQMTEHKYIGVRCGVMDQFTALQGRAGELIRLDCRTLDYEMVPFRPEGYRVLLVDSMIKGGNFEEYNIRRSQCEMGVRILARHVPRVTMLRDISPDMLDTYRDEMPAEVYRRCRFVIDENDRVLRGSNLLRAGDYEGFGREMYASHRGLSEEYGVSCAELDFIQQIARETDGVIGSRMMGAGWGGCVINLVREDCADAFVAEVQRRYRDRFGLAARSIDVVISDGAHREA